MQNSNESAVYNKERKKFLSRNKLISCQFCPYHKGENRTYRQRTDKHKNKNRHTIRKYYRIEIEESGE